MTATVSISAIEKFFGKTQTLKGVSLDVGAGEFMTLVGPSGCGKSTLLRIIAGLAHQDAGSVAINGKSVDSLPPKARDVSMVFQSYALYPHMSVYDNIATPLKVRRLSPLARLPVIGRLIPGLAVARATIAEDVRQVADQVDIANLLNRRPAQLSGGQRQRVALARAMVRQPRVFLMDEPLSNLDARLRVHMRGELTELHRRLGATFIYVTHDQVEAMTMSTRVALMIDGEIVQVGAPRELYTHPLDIRVARFIGSPEINLLSGVVGSGGQVAFGGYPTGIQCDTEGKVTIGLRPEVLRVGVHSAEFALRVRVQRIEHLGHDALLHVRHEGAGEQRLVIRLHQAEFERLRTAGQFDEVLTVGAEAADALLFDPAGRRIGSRSAGVEMGPDRPLRRVG